MSPIEVTTRDTETGETETKVVRAGDYCIVAVYPLYMDGVVYYGNGTVVVTLKKAKEGGA